MNKLAGPPASEELANSRKASTDAMASALMGIDTNKVAKMAKEIAPHISKPHPLSSTALSHLPPPVPKVFVTGGAGSGKSTLAPLLAKELGVKSFDFDEYVSGGWTADPEIYQKRFFKALHDLWGDLPSKEGFVIEHVGICHPDAVSILHPTHAVLLDPGEDHLKRAAEARNVVGSFDATRVKRAFESANRARRLFGNGTVRGKGWELKQF